MLESQAALIFLGVQPTFKSLAMKFRKFQWKTPVDSNILEKNIHETACLRVFPLEGA